MFFGSIPALVTPFSGGRVAEDTFRDFVEWQIAEGSNALVPCGTTGESATLTHDEHRQVIATDRRGGEGPRAGDRRLRQLFDGRRRSSWSGPRPTSAPTRRWSSCPITTSRARPGSSRISRAIAEASPIPIVVYNVPSRTVADISVETLAEDREASRTIVAHQGRDRQSRPRLRAAARLRRGFRPAVGQRRHGARLQRHGRRRLHLGHRQCRAEALLRVPEGDARRPLGRSAQAAGQALSAARGPVHRCLAGARPNMR